MKLSAICICLISFLFLLSCTTVPSELVTSNALQKAAMEAAARNHATVVNAYHDQLVKAFEMAWTERWEREVAKLAAADKLTETEVNTLRSELEVVRQKTLGQLAAKRDQFVVDNNLNIAIELNSKEGEWIKMIEGAARNFDEIVNTAKGLFGKGEVKKEDLDQ